MPRLRALRLSAPMSLQELADKAEVSTRTVWLAEKGKRVPQPAKMRQIAAALDVSVQEIDEFRTAIEAKSAA